MPLRTDDVQAAQFLDAFHIFEVLQEELDLGVINAVVRWVDLLQGFASFFLGHVKWVFIPGPAKHAVDRGDGFFGQLTAQLDIHTAPGHVRSNRHRTERTGAGDDLRLLGMLAGVQHLMRNAALQHFFETVYVAFLESKNIKDNLQVRGILGVDICNPIGLNELAQRVGCHFF